MINYKKIQIVVLCTFICSLIACQDKASDHDSHMISTQNERIPTLRPQNDELQVPQLNFGKSDQTQDAQLRSELMMGQSEQGSMELAQVFPMFLKAGEQVKLHTWANDWVALYVFKPGKQQNWTEELVRSQSESVKVGVESKEILIKAEESGQYAIVVQALSKAKTQFILNAECKKGMCLESITQAEQEAVQEEIEASTVREAPVSSD